MCQHCLEELKTLPCWCIQVLLLKPFETWELATKRNLFITQNLVQIHITLYTTFMFVYCSSSLIFQQLSLWMQFLLSCNVKIYSQYGLKYAKPFVRFINLCSVEDLFHQWGVHCFCAHISSKICTGHQRSVSDALIWYHPDVKSPH